MARSLYYVKLGIVTLLVISMFGCSKYDEGGMSLTSKHKLLQQTWILDTIIDKSNNSMFEEFSEPMPNIKFDFNKDGSFTQLTETPDTSFTLNGTWDFTDKKESLKLNYNESDFLLSLLGSQEDLFLKYGIHSSEVLKQFPSLDISSLTIPNTFRILKLKKDSCWIEYSLTIPLYVTSISIRYEIRLKAE